MKTIVITSGFFNPIHRGHLAYFRDAKQLGDFHIVIVNNDQQVKLKSSLPFQVQNERLEIVGELRSVDRAILSIDRDPTVCKSLKKIWNEYHQDAKLIFANGGDRTKKNIPESEVCKKLGISHKFGVGGEDKMNSSSTLKENILKV